MLLDFVVVGRVFFKAFQIIFLKQHFEKVLMEEGEWKEGCLNNEQKY
jgi:hypothetical protein